MGSPSKPYFEIMCMKHGSFISGFTKEKFLKVGVPRGKRKSGCSLCRKEYVKKHNIKKPEDIDWRYIQFD